MVSYLLKAMLIGISGTICLNKIINKEDAYAFYWGMVELYWFVNLLDSLISK